MDGDKEIPVYQGALDNNLIKLVVRMLRELDSLLAQHNALEDFERGTEGARAIASKMALLTKLLAGIGTLEVVNKKHSLKIVDDRYQVIFKSDVVEVIQ